MFIVNVMLLVIVVGVLIAMIVATVNCLSCVCVLLLYLGCVYHDCVTYSMCVGIVT